MYFGIVNLEGTVIWNAVLGRSLSSQHFIATSLQFIADPLYAYNKPLGLKIQDERPNVW
jgi:hypothetical protein